MSDNYQFLDANGSILTAAAKDVGGGILQPLVQISSIQIVVPVIGNQSVSGTINISGNPSISGTVLIGNNASISGTVGASIIGQLPGGTAVLGSITALQGTNPWLINGSIQGIGSVGAAVPDRAVYLGIQNNAGNLVGITNPANIADGVTGNSALPTFNWVFNGSNWDRQRGNSSIGALVSTGSSSVITLQSGTQISSLVSTVPSSVIVGASIFGQLPAGTAVLGSVATLQGTNPWNIAGSVAAFQVGTWSPSAIGYQYRNDTLASTLGADQTYGPSSRDSAGRTLTKPFSAEESRVEGYASVVSTSVTTLVAAAGTGLRNYITDIWFANSDATNGTLVTLKDGAGSILGYTYAPSKSGSNLPGLQTPIRTGANATFDFQATTGVSILFATVKGFKAP